MEAWQTYELTDPRLTDRQRRRLELDRVHRPALYAAIGFDRASDGLTTAAAHAVDAAADPDATPARLVFALDGLDRDWGYTLSQWSNAAAGARSAHAYLSKLAAAGKGEAALPAVLRADLRRERETLAAFLGQIEGATWESRLRAVLVGRLILAGVTVADWRANGCVSSLALALRSLPGLRVAVRRQPDNAWCHERIAALTAELAAAGLAA